MSVHPLPWIEFQGETPTHLANWKATDRRVGELITLATRHAIRSMRRLAPRLVFATVAFFSRMSLLRPPLSRQHVLVL